MKHRYSQRHIKLRTHLREARLAAGLTQEQLCKRLKRNSKFVSQIETGTVMLDVLEFIEYAEAMGLGSAEVVGQAAQMSYFPGSGHALTLSEGAEKLAYCYYCKACPHKERVNLTRLAADYPLETKVGDLAALLRCAACGSTEKTIMLLWLGATTTDQMLRERGFPVWSAED